MWQKCGTGSLKCLFLLDEWILFYTNSGTGKNIKGLWLTTYWDNDDFQLHDNALIAQHYEQQQNWDISDIIFFVILKYIMINILLVMYTCNISDTNKL